MALSFYGTHACGVGVNVGVGWTSAGILDWIEHNRGATCPKEASIGLALFLSSITDNPA